MDAATKKKCALMSGHFSYFPVLPGRGQLTDPVHGAVSLLEKSPEASLFDDPRSVGQAA
jgi:hypothetical protein